MIFFFFFTQESGKSLPCDGKAVTESCILKKGTCALWKGETLRELWQSLLKFKDSPWQLVEAKMRPQSPGQRGREAGARTHSLGTLEELYLESQDKIKEISRKISDGNMVRLYNFVNL